jgi:hypothetical protein
MKKIIISLAAIMMTTIMFAQKSTDIPVSKLPKAATEYLTNNLPGTTITKAAKIEDKGEITYSATVDVKGKKHLFIFDKEGKFLKKGDDLVAEPAKDKSAAKPAEKPLTDEEKALRK